MGSLNRNRNFNNTELESPMKTSTLTAALMTAGLLMTSVAFAQSAHKQPAQDGGGGGPNCDTTPSISQVLSPDCRDLKEQTQNLTPGFASGMEGTTLK
jgi:hypothetical protein